MSNRLLRSASGILSPLAKPIYRYIHIGDSLTQGSGDAQINVFGSTDMTWQTALASNGALLPVRNGGVGGHTSPMIAARVVRDVVKYAPDVVGVTLGTNDVIIFNHANSILKSLQSIHETLKSAGVFYFFTTIPPYASRAALVTTVNGIISGFCAENNVPLVDWYAIANDPANAGSWKANYSYDGTHPTHRTSDRFARANWAAIAPSLTSTRKHQRTAVHSPANLLFPPSGIANTGLPVSSTERDGLFANYRTLGPNFNGYTVITPYLWDSVSTAAGTQPTVTTAMEQVAGVNGNVWKIAAAPNGAGAVTWNITNTATPAIDLTRYQGRRVRWSFMFGTEGFDTDNTDAYLAAHSNASLSSCGVALSLRDRAGNALPSLSIPDPVDGAGTLGQASNLSMDWGVYLFSNPNGYRHAYDLPMTPVSVELNVPPGAFSANLQVVVRFFTGAVSPVIMRLAEFSFVDVGPAQYPALAVNNDPLRFLELAAATTLSRAQIISIDYYRCNAASAAFAVTLPAANSVAGIPIIIKKTDSSGNAVTIAANGAELIDGASTLALASQFQFFRLISNGTGWDVIGEG